MNAFYNPFTLEGKTILITGASSGIGRATAIECSKLGANLVLTGRDAERLNETLRATSAEGNSNVAHIADLTSEEDVAALVEKTPRLDGFFCNAGRAKTKPLAFVSSEDLEQVYRINVFAPFLLTKYLVKKKKLKNPSSIVYTSSIGGVTRYVVGAGVYGSSKNSVDALMKYAALELASKGVRCNSVNPGMTETPLINRGVVSNEQREKDVQSYPLGRYGKAQEIAWAVVYLLSDASAWVTGSSLVVDGGFSLT